ncbi:MAG: tetratricopeptide repeat protein [Acidobacteriaceae bacterium]
MATKPATSTSESKPTKAPRTLAGNAQHANDAARKSTLALYESALKLMQAGKYEKAHEAFVKMLESAPQDLADRIRMYISACVAQIDKGTTAFQTHEERYDYAISLLNAGNYEDARQHLQEILLKEKSADYAFYGLALLASLTGDTDGCIDHLTEAIRLNHQNRFQARLDSDFDGVAEDPRFTELLYPEV